MLKIDSIKYNFGKKIIFENVSLSLKPNKVYGIVGSNGVGKTTLFRVLAGQYKSRSGKMTWMDKSLSRKDICFLPTDPYFYPYMTAGEYLAIVITDMQKLDLAISMSKSLNLSLDQIVNTYSTGMKKKLAFIANYILNRPISIYDEPFNGVDLESNELLCSFLKEKKDGQLTLLSSHILSMLDEVCDEILHIEEGYKITTYQPDQFSDLKLHIKNRLGI
ncbi:MAG: ABC-2 type transport system ATP-binding protein [Saprospiraceae bacterium]|jgi:ABC-2 type transport system ATP-binding protein